MKSAANFRVNIFYPTYIADHFWYQSICLIVKKLLTKKNGNACT